MKLLQRGADSSFFFKSRKSCVSEHVKSFLLLWPTTTTLKLPSCMNNHHHTKPVLSHYPPQAHWICPVVPPKRAYGMSFSSSPPQAHENNPVALTTTTTLKHSSFTSNHHHTEKSPLFFTQNMHPKSLVVHHLPQAFWNCSLAPPTISI